MKIKMSLLALAAFAMVSLPNIVNAQAYFNGTGIDDGYMTTGTGVGTTPTGATSTVSVSLRGRNYGENVFNQSGSVYTFAAGISPLNGLRAIAQLDFSISSDSTAVGAGTVGLGNYVFRLGIDLDASIGTSYSYINPLTFFGDNALGFNTTTDGGANYGGAFAGFTVAQNSENLFFPFMGGNGLTNGNFVYTLQAFNVSDTSFSNAIASTTVEFRVGDQGQLPAFVPVPEPSTYAMFGVVGLMGIVAAKRFRSRKVTATPAA